MSVIRFFASDNPQLHITEFGYSAPDTPRQVGPWVRDTYILHVVTKGRCEFSEFTVQDGEAFLISKNKLHAFEVKPPYEHYWFAFEGDDVPRLFATYHIPLHKHQHFKLSHTALVHTILETAFETADNENGIAATNSAFAAILPLLQTQPAHLHAHKNGRMQRVANFLDTHYAFPITMQQAADTVHLSEKYVYKQFKAQFGIAPQQYLLRARMDRAKLLLATTDLQIGEIAASVGYVSPLNFSAAFKKFYGTSPSCFRKKL